MLAVALNVRRSLMSSRHAQQLARRCAWGALVGLLATGPSCGKKEPPPRAPQLEEPTVSSSDEEDEGSVTSEIGGLNEAKVSFAFKQSLKGLTRCIEQGASRNEYLSGEVSFFVLIGRSGSLSEAYVERSTLGDRETEKCMLAVLGEQTWPKPVGGEKGEARKSFTFDLQSDVRPPVDWESSELDPTLRKLARKIEACKNGVDGPFQTTLYVDTSGRALGAGIAPPSAAGEESVDCLVEVLMEARYPSPGSWPAKVQFEL